MDERTTIEYRGVRIDLAHMNPATRTAMLREADHWIAAGHRPPIVTVRNGGVDVSEQPELWPATVSGYRGLGRLEWVGDTLR